MLRRSRCVKSFLQTPLFAGSEVSVFGRFAFRTLSAFETSLLTKVVDAPFVSPWYNLTHFSLGDAEKV